MPQDPKSTPLTSGIDVALNSLSSTTKNFQTLATEITQMSKQSFEHATQTFEKLRNAHSLDEVVAIQTGYVKEVFEEAAARTKRLGELVSTFPNELTKSYQDALQQSLNTAAQATDTVVKTTASNVERLADIVNK
ncbi:phasin family protein [Beijerinckia indica]|uniref:Phasin domain-containing protein n=1 Tax=Beijerinckia indica subsp. indica (strain ATCC 9039 / DSM 1715 / NCIMB 8712) TaxID=395963 RepID=B2IHX5_BEII9|nr:phasin family protein [Beijerinckia indica]ACB96018.1 hypothetical protein Bind_2407 [Beijerinckia indica subsp. indica ATCC 9039]